MKTRFHLNPASPSWLEICRSKGWTVDSVFPSGGLYETLKQKLLSVSGHVVVLHFEEDLQKILSRGRFYRGYNSRTMKGDPCGCHRNAANLWSVNRRKLSIVTGYALSVDGGWRQHSWCVDEDHKVIETTTKRVLYFGFPLTPAEAAIFLYNNG